VLDVRVYRAAFLPALVALFVAAFSLVDRPGPATSGQSADAFDAGRAFGTATPPPRNSLRELAGAFGDRRPGSAGDRALADRIATALGAVDPTSKRPLFTVTRQLTPGGARDAGELETVVGVRPGLSSRRVVVVAHRDSPGGPGLAQLSATATLLELARDVRARELTKTLVLVSTTGASTGYAGARAWAESTEADMVDGVIVLGDLAGRKVRRPWVVPWPASEAPLPLALARTLENAARREVGSQPGGPRATAQWIRRAVPVTVSGQGVIGAAGLPAVMLGVSGERGPASGEQVSRGRLGAFGRTALRGVLAVDATGGDRQVPFDQGPRGIVTMRNVLPDWAVRLVTGTLLLPALLVGLDAFFRIRRRRVPTGPWFAWLAGPALAVAAAWLWARLLGLTGALDAPPALVAPAVLPLTGGGAVALGSVVVVGGLAWFALRSVVRRRGLGSGGHPAAGGLAAATGLVLGLGVALAWAANPYLAALLLPAAHLWLFAAAPGGRMQGLSAVPAVVIGLLGPLLVLVYYALTLGAGPLDLAWLVLLGAAGGNVSLTTLIVVCAYVAGLAGVLRTVASQRKVSRDAPPERIRTRGPLSYAGPGSLGGTESALRR
jgi:hypothetical protein